MVIQKTYRALYLILSLFILGLVTSCSEVPVIETPEPTTPDNALDHYINNDDTTYTWELKNTYTINSVQAYDLLLTSQTWQGHKWIHQLTILVPAVTIYDDALLYITGGSVHNGEVTFKGVNDGEATAMAYLALMNQAVVVVLRQVPLQPLYEGKYEDELISHTLHQYILDGDLTWPLLFPMTKSAVRAMDATQEYTEQELNLSIDEFVVTGASKRGWTTWLTGASDNRVKAIAPMVIDMLNIPESIPYHLETWGSYSYQIQDYVDLGLTEELTGTGGPGTDLVKMIDPYSYRDVLTMPKLILLGTNDPYWPVDVIKHYYDDIPGKNLIHYVPNAGHDLDLDNNLQSIWALNSFFAITISNNEYPDCDWVTSETNDSYTLTVNATADKLVDATYWSTTSSTRDFRNSI
ncbi:MAG: PhoPQ-activated protein PqaA family protein, partial [Bacteroidota bacterium]